jgi:hypothetical protein
MIFELLKMVATANRFELRRPIYQCNKRAEMNKETEDSATSL